MPGTIGSLSGEYLDIDHVLIWSLNWSRYYEKQGCTVVDDFAGLNTNGVMWHGTFYRMDVTEYRGYLQL